MLCTEPARRPWLMVLPSAANGIPIEGWINDPTDECLLDLLPMLDSLRFTNDVRRVLGLRGFSKSSGGDSLAIPPRVRTRAR